MNYDQERYFAHDFAQKLSEALFAECQPMSVSLFVKIAKCIGADTTKAEEFAKRHRVICPERKYDEFVTTLRLTANVIESGKKHAKKK
jgi:hypothetical protein